MRHVTHENFLKLLYPFADMNIARQINREVDNPKGFGLYNKSVSTPFDIPGLIKYPHRKKHDALTMGIIGAKYGREGIIAMAGHAIGDIMRDKMVQRYGRRNADLWEALFNYYSTGVFEQRKNKSRKYRSFNLPNL